MSRFDRWSRDGMPDDAANYQIQKGIDATMREIVKNYRIPTSASMIPPAKNETPPAPGGGSTELRSPPGINYIDRMVEEQSRKEKLVAQQQAAELAEIERRLRGGGHDPYQAKIHYDPLAKADREIESCHREKK